MTIPLSIIDADELSCGDPDELVVTSVTHRHEDRLRSHRLIAERWGL